MFVIKDFSLLEVFAMFAHLILHTIWLEPDVFALKDFNL